MAGGGVAGGGIVGKLPFFSLKKKLSSLKNPFLSQSQLSLFKKKLEGTSIINLIFFNLFSLFFVGSFVYRNDSKVIGMEARSDKRSG